MVTLTIDGKKVTVEKNTTILQAAASVGITIPTLCYYKDLLDIGACRVCVVEIVGEKRLVAACNTVVGDGMEILTDSPRAFAARKTNIELILSQHKTECAKCVRGGNCVLESLAKKLGILSPPYPEKIAKTDLGGDFPLIKDASKCIKCFRCVEECEKIQGLKIWQVTSSGKRTKISTFKNVSLSETDCSLCGQCATHCPTGALYARDDTKKVTNAIASDKIVVFQIAPAVRTAWAEKLKLGEKDSTEKKLCAAVHKLGADYVFDTEFAADLTIMEEGTEFLQKFTTKSDNLPLFTSCCPGWVRFVKSKFPAFINKLSSAKSPQQMFGAVAKTYFAQKIGVSADKIFCVSVMPCIAKKDECELEGFYSSGAKDVDVVLTTRELVRMITAHSINIPDLSEREFDKFMGEGTGAAAIFGATGGVMEAALRTAYFLVNGKNPPPDAFKEVRRSDSYGLREAEFTLKEGVVVKTAVVSGLKKTERLLKAIQRGEKQYDFVEVMACPGGCVGGGGQPVKDGVEMSLPRAKKLYALDEKNPLRFSHENPEIIEIYKDFLIKPLSEKAHELLHVNHFTNTSHKK